MGMFFSPASWHSLLSGGHTVERGLVTSTYVRLFVFLRAESVLFTFYQSTFRASPPSDFSRGREDAGYRSPSSPSSPAKLSGGEGPLSWLALTAGVVC